MAVVQIPIESDLPDQELSVTLEGEIYQLRLRWNDRAGSWYLSLSDSAGDAIVSGKRIAVSFPLLQRVADSRMPGGVFLAVDTEGGNEDPGLTELGARVLLVYVEATSVPDFFGDNFGAITF